MFEFLRFDGVITKLHYEVDEIAQTGDPLVDIEVIIFFIRFVRNCSNCFKIRLKRLRMPAAPRRRSLRLPLPLQGAAAMATETEASIEHLYIY